MNGATGLIRHRRVGGILGEIQRMGYQRIEARFRRRL